MHARVIGDLDVVSLVVEAAARKASDLSTADQQSNKAGDLILYLE